MLIPTYYLLSKICDIFATRRRILLKINKNYFRGGQISNIKSINKEFRVGNAYAEFFVSWLANVTGQTEGICKIAM